MKFGKILICFKCPDAKFYAVKNYIENLQETDKSYDCQKEQWQYKDIEEGINNKLNKWIKWGELVTIEVDLDNITARVCENVTRS